MTKLPVQSELYYFLTAGCCLGSAVCVFKFLGSHTPLWFLLAWALLVPVVVVQFIKSKPYYRSEKYSKRMFNPIANIKITASLIWPVGKRGRRAIVVKVALIVAYGLLWSAMLMLLLFGPRERSGF